MTLRCRKVRCKCSRIGSLLPRIAVARVRLVPIEDCDVFSAVLLDSTFLTPHLSSDRSGRSTSCRHTSQPPKQRYTRANLRKLCLSKRHVAGACIYLSDKEMFFGNSVRGITIKGGPVGFETGALRQKNVR